MDDLADRLRQSARTSEPVNLAEDEVVPAALLREILVEPHDEPRRWIALRQTRVEGELDLDNATLTSGLRAVDCVFPRGLDLTDARAPRIALVKCRLLRFNARGVEVRGDLQLSRSSIAHDLDIMGARVSGNLNLVETTIGDEEHDPIPFFGDSMIVEGSILAQRMAVKGTFSLRGAEIGGQIQLDGARLTAEELAIAGDRLIVRNGVFLTGGFDASGAVRLVGANIGGQFVIEAAKLDGRDEDAIVLDGSLIGSDVHISDTSIDGTVALPGTRIEGEVVLQTSTVATTEGVALRAPRMWVRDDVFVVDATFGGTLDLDALHTGGGLRIVSSSIGSEPGHGLSLDGAEIHQDLVLHGVRCVGQTSLMDARVEGQLVVIDSHLEADGEAALNAFGVTVHAFATLSDVSTAGGGVVLLGAQVRDLSIRDVTLDSHDGIALDLERSTVAGKLTLRPATLHGSVDFTGATVATIDDSADSWPAAVRLRGLSYERIDPHPPVSVDERLAWLQRDVDGYAPQPYAMLAAAYRTAGYEEHARTVVIAGRRARRAELAWPSKIWDFALDRGIAYGYATWRAVVGLAVLATLGFLVFSQQYPEHFTAARTGPDASQPAFHSITYTLDVLVPVISLRQRDVWTPDGYALWWSVGLTFLGWVLTTAVVAALTGLLRRE